MSNLTITRPKFTDYQTKILGSEKRFTITEASTKCGKTFSHLFWLFEEAHKGKKGYEYWWVAPVYSQAEIAFKRLYRKVAESQVYIINLSKLSITTPIGTVISFKSADNPSNLYGENVHAFVFDEYSRAKEDAWFALRTTITYTKAKGKFIGNVVAKNWAYDLARRAERGADPDFEYFKVNAYQAVDAGILSLQEVDQAKKDLPARIFEMLYMANFAELGIVFKSSWFRYFTQEELHSQEIFNGDLAIWNFVGDTAYDNKEINDPSAFIAYSHYRNNLYIADVARVYMQMPELIRFTKDFVTRNKYTVHSSVKIEPKASGKSLVQMLKKETGLNVMEGKAPTKDKRTRAEMCVPFVESGRVYLLEGAGWVNMFIDEVCTFPNSQHDDIVDCFTMTMSESYVKEPEYFLPSTKKEEDDDEY